MPFGDRGMKGISPKYKEGWCAKAHQLFLLWYVHRILFVAVLL